MILSKGRLTSASMDCSHQQTAQPSFIGFSHSVNNVLLATALACYDSPLHQHTLRLLIDTGSELSFITEDAVKIIGIQRFSSNIPILGISGLSSGHTLGKVQLTLKSMHRDIKMELTAHILRKLSSSLPSFTCIDATWSHINKLCLADPDFGQPRKIDILIGADHYGKIIKPNIIRGLPDEPIAQLSIFGWLVIGPTQSCLYSPKVVHYAQLTTDGHSHECTLTVLGSRRNTSFNQSYSHS